MVRISKLTDYGIVLLTYFSHDPTVSVQTARDLSEKSRVPLPTTGKLLKALARGGLLVAQRGIHGGYRLARSPGEISVAQIIDILEGPVSMTECSTAEGSCEMEISCPVRSNWRKINDTVRFALENLSLAEMGRPMTEASLTTEFISEERGREYENRGA